MNKGNTFEVYDENLNFKYPLDVNIWNSPEHLAYNDNVHWLVTDREKLYSFSRTGSNLNLISENNLYNQNYCCSRINVMDIKQNRILAGNHEENHGLIVEISMNGELSNTTTSVDLNLTSEWKNNSLFSENENYILNVEDKTVISTITNNLITTLNSNFFPSGVGNDGSQILGTYNNPENSNDSFHEKKIRLLTYPTLNEQVHDVKGYPNVMFQNYLGQIVSISKALIGDLDKNTLENDIFIEIIEP